MLYVNQLIIEVTRQCNMACGHCLRGDAQSLNIRFKTIEQIIDCIEHVTSVTFTGGEPTLNLDAIEHYFEYARSKDKLPSSFYCVTNGTGNQLRLATILLKYYPYMDEQDICGVALSIDEFHETPDDPEVNTIRGLSFYDTTKETKYPGKRIIAEGRGAKFTDAVPLEPYDDFSIENYANGDIAVEELYVAANGNLYPDCDASYERVDKESKYNIHDIDAFMQHIMANTEEKS